MNKFTVLISFLIGVLFSIGLILSGMMYPQNIQDFLDVTGKWNPSLLLVLGASVGVTFSLFPFVLRRSKPLFHHRFLLPTKKDIDKKLVIGSILFGVGWALSGMCPGPAFVNTLSFSPQIVVFVLLVVGSYAFYEQLLR